MKGCPPAALEIEKKRTRFRRWGTRAGGRRAHVFDCACPTQTCPRALCVLSMSHVGHAEEHAFACPKKFLTIWRAVFRVKFLKNRVPEQKNNAI